MFNYLNYLVKVFNIPFTFCYQKPKHLQHIQHFDKKELISVNIFYRI